MLLGRRLLAAPAAREVATRKGKQALSQAHEAVDAALLARAEQDDRFFCLAMENIPAQYYFPTDEEDNWRRSAPKKYHKDVQAQSGQVSSKKAAKRATYAAAGGKSNEERQLESAAEEKKLKAAAPVNPKTTTAEGLDGLKERLAVKIQAMREQRKADEKTGKKRQRTNANANAKPLIKKRKTDKKVEEAGSKVEQKAKEEQPEAVSASGISYGSLLLNDEDKQKKPEKKTRNGQGIRGIKNLLKKAERNQQRLEELKKTEEGKAVVQQKGWDKAIKQAAGEVVMDDPKLLRNKLKKKEKQKAKSSKEWKQRTTKLEMDKKERQKKRMANARGAKAKDAKDDDKKKPKGPRAGFEGKKGEAFLNGGDKKKQQTQPKKK